LEIQFTLTPTDYWQLSKYYMLYDTRGKVWLIFVLLTVPALAFQTVVSQGPGSGRVGNAVIVAAGVLVFWTLVFYLLMRLRAWGAYRLTPGDWKVFHMRLAANALEFETGAGQTQAKWTSIIKIVEDTKLIYLFANRRVAYLVPKRAFSSADEAAAFSNQARDYWTQAQSGA
jgi:hypothetical protein